eukprot:3990970-Pyramimonas_sp.AAC.1
MSPEATWDDARRLSALVDQTIRRLGWEAHLPVRVEVFVLEREAFGDRINSMPMSGRQRVASAEHTDVYGTVTHLHHGHPSLRTSKQFVDRPAVHDLSLIHISEPTRPEPI